MNVEMIYTGVDNEINVYLFFLTRDNSIKQYYDKSQLMKHLFHFLVLTFNDNYYI